MSSDKGGWSCNFYREGNSMSREKGKMKVGLNSAILKSDMKWTNRYFLFSYQDIKRCKIRVWGPWRLIPEVALSIPQRRTKEKELRYPLLEIAFLLEDFLEVALSSDDFWLSSAIFQKICKSEYSCSFCILSLALKISKSRMWYNPVKCRCFLPCLFQTVGCL